ncbi:MAG: ATPase, T2SS/T4P/T4SS family [Candidatus Nezhaarchaeales archaeon]
MILKLSLLNRRREALSVVLLGKKSVIKYDPSTLNMLLDYSVRLSKLRELLLDLTFRDKAFRCVFSEPCNHDCPIFKEFLGYKNCFAFLNHLGMAYTDPFRFYIFTASLIDKLEDLEVRHYYKKCLQAFIVFLKSSLNEIERSQLITAFKDYYCQFGDRVYSEALQPACISERTKPLGASHKGSLVKEYYVDIYSIKILESRALEYIYNVSLNLPYTIKYLFAVLNNNLDTTSFLDNIIKMDSLWEKICSLRREYEKILKELRFEFSHNDLLRKVASYLAYRTLGVHKIMPFLLDENVDEIYLDKPQSKVYLDHSDFGRCISNVLLTNRDVERLITHVKIESKLPLNYLNPSLKWNMEINNYTLRVSIDTPPLSYEGPSLDLRKIRHKSFTIIDLVKAGTLSLEEAAFIMLHVLNRRNIIICGEPGSGKTTLMNALDFCTPKNWRKVYIEDVVESWEQRSQGRHQLRLYVEPFETKKKLRRKSSEIIRLLHRTPDWICMGELQTKEHFRALFHALTAGLKGIHTCHASSITGLIKRWILHCNIPKEDVFEVDLIIHMIKCHRGTKVIRRVNEIWAVGELHDADHIEIAGIPLTLIFKWNPQYDNHEMCLFDVLKAPSVSKIVSLGVSSSMLREEYGEIKSLLEKMLSRKSLDLMSFISMYDNLIQSLIKRGIYVF